MKTESKAPHNATDNPAPTVPNVPHAVAPEPIHITHADEYKILREEIMERIRQLYHTEIIGSVAIAAIYAWIFTNTGKITGAAIWFIPPAIIFAAALRTVDLLISLNMLGDYLKQLEEKAFSNTPDLPGWEHYRLNSPFFRYMHVTNVVAIVMWILAFIGACVAPLIL